MTFNRTLLTATMLTLGGFAAMSANAAGEAKGSFNVTTTIVSACTVAAAPSAQNIAFGEIASGTALNTASIKDKTSATALSVMCSTGAPYIINLSSLNNENSTDGIGKMNGPDGNFIEYKLFSDTESTVWGGTGTLSNVGNGVSGTGEGVTQAKNHPVYATMSSTTDVKVGNYTDTVNVSVLY